MIKLAELKRLQGTWGVGQETMRKTLVLLTLEASRKTFMRKSVLEDLSLCFIP